MKPMTPNYLSIQNVSIATLIILSILIWFAGPHIAIANHLPLQSPEKRFGIIVIMFLGWVLLKLTFTPPKKNKMAIPATTPETVKKLQALQGRFQGAMNFLKKTIISKHGVEINLSQIPWYVVIGPKNSGKTTLLANSHVNFILAKQFKPETLKAISSSENCDWWVTRDLVLVDVPGNYIQSKEKGNVNSPRASLHNVLWTNLINLIHEHRKKNALNGIVITLNLPEIIKEQNQTQKNSVVHDIKNHIIDLRAKFGKQLPCYIIITKCDYLPGFIEFFGDSSTDEAAQAWGITLPALNPNEKLLDIFTHRFNALIKRLNKQLITHLHQERNPNARSLIKDFPLQLERIKDAMNQFLKALGISDLNLHGVYFTSAIQTETEETNSSSNLTINHGNQQALQVLQQPAMPSRAYFVRQLITQGLLHSHDHVAASPSQSLKNNWQRKAIYATSFAALLTATILLGHDFQHGIQQTYAIQNDLTQYQLHMQQTKQQGNHLVDALPLLNALENASENSKHRLSNLTNLLTFYSKKSQQTANMVYTQALQTIVLPEIKSNLEKYLKTSDEKNPTQLYAILKAYLMLGDATHLQTDFVVNSMRQFIPATINKQMFNELKGHMTTALNSMPQPIELDANLIAQVQKQLGSLPSVDLAYVILKNIANNNSDSAIRLGTDNKDAPVFISNAVVNQIPVLFTAEAFPVVLSQEINTAATEAAQGNWVIGSTNTQSPATLADQLRTQYIANYIDIWESRLANIQLFSPKNLAQLDAMLAALTSNNSPLLEMLKTIQHNTEFSSIIDASPKLQSLNTLLANANSNQSNSLYKMFVNLRELHSYLQPLVHATDPGDAIFQATKLRAKDPTQDPITQLVAIANQLPDPMKTWLSNITTQTWNLMIQETSLHIDHAWQKEIIEPYNAQIANRFPFARDATQEVSLQAFTNFLGQPGALTNFYQAYLRPFIEESKTDVQWKEIDKQKLPFKNDILEQIQNAAKIQRAFFPNGDNKLYVQFTLQPVSLQGGAKSINININGQQFNYERNGPIVPRAISWPGNNIITHATSINFVTPSNQLINSTLQGDWGWFRLVNKSTRNINSRKEILLTFDIDGHNAQYLLFTQGHLNPFLPLNLENLHLPQTLM